MDKKDVVKKFGIYADSTDLNGRPHNPSIFQPYLFILSDSYKVAESVVEVDFNLTMEDVIFIDDEDKTRGRTGVVLHILRKEGLSIKEMRIRSYLDHYPDKFNVIEIRM